jgi:AcrR family transcriptional regulator
MTVDDKRQHIMQAAEELFTSRRFHEITMDDVATAAGVGKGTLYRYFEDKDDLFFQTATNGFELLCEVVGQVSHDCQFSDQLLSACDKITRFMDSRRALFTMMQAEQFRMLWLRGDLRDRWMQTRRKLISAVGAILAKGVAEGAVRGDLPLETLATYLLVMLRARSQEMAADSDAAHPLEVTVELFCNGVGPKNREAVGPEDRGTVRP